MDVPQVVAQLVCYLAFFIAAINFKAKLRRPQNEGKDGGIDAANIEQLLSSSMQIILSLSLQLKVKSIFS